MNFITISQAKKDTGLSYLGNVNHSAKLIKNSKVNGQLTYGLYLAPYTISGHNTCPNSTPECRIGCLFTSGRSAIETFSGISKIKDARIAKTKLFYENNEFFMSWLIAEIKQKREKAKRENLGFSVRLNATSDIDWHKTYFKGYNIFEIFPDVQFYDYTKNPVKFMYKADNYHLTLSYTGRNWDMCEKILSKGHNVAMVFNVKKESEIPATYKGYDVINGDITDYRVADAKGIIVGLKWKRIANRDDERKVLNSVFVVTPANTNSNVQLNELELATV